MCMCKTTRGMVMGAPVPLWQAAAAAALPHGYPLMLQDAGQGMVQAPPATQ